MVGEDQASWEDRLRLAWCNILCLTRNFYQEGFNIIIDFVVEDELEWFREQLSDLDKTAIKYVLLRAEPDTLLERLRLRGDARYLDRSLFLLNKLTSTPKNQSFILDTDGKETKDVVDFILGSDHFELV